MKKNIYLLTFIPIILSSCVPGQAVFGSDPYSQMAYANAIGDAANASLAGTQAALAEKAQMATIEAMKTEDAMRYLYQMATMTADQENKAISAQSTQVASTIQAIDLERTRLEYTAEALEFFEKRQHATYQAYQDNAAIQITITAQALAAIRNEKNADYQAAFFRTIPWLIAILLSLSFVSFIVWRLMKEYYRSAIVRETSYGLVAIRGHIPQLLTASGLPVSDIEWINPEPVQKGSAESLIDDRQVIGKLLYDAMRIPGLAQQSRIPGWRELKWSSASNWDRAIKFLYSTGWIERRMTEEPGRPRRETWHTAGAGTVSTLWESYRSGEIEEGMPSPTATDRWSVA